MNIKSVLMETAKQTAAVAAVVLLAKTVPTVGGLIGVSK